MGYISSHRGITGSPQAVQNAIVRGYISILGATFVLSRTEIWSEDSCRTPVLRELLSARDQKVNLMCFSVNQIRPVYQEFDHLVGSFLERGSVIGFASESLLIKTSDDWSSLKLHMKILEITR